MKNLNGLYFANWVFLGTSLLFYLTIFFGAFLHILFGAFQIVIAFYLLYHFKKLTKNIQYQLLLYFVFTTFTCITPFVFHEEIAVYAWFTTWVLALYFIGILYQTKNLHYEN